MTEPIRFGIGVPTATEGMMYPVPYAGIEDAVRFATQAETLGYDSVWGNDHVSTQNYVRREHDQPPSFFDPLTYLAFVAAVTEHIRLATCVLVLPFRNPVLVAKQAATLDRLSGGRFVLGVGVGAYREEFEAVWPDRSLHRGRYVDESVEALNLLLTDRQATYRGDLVAFENVESFPKPIQNPLPVLSGGNSFAARRRASRYCNGWLPACLTPDEFHQGLIEIQEEAAQASRALDGFEAAIQVAVSVDPIHEVAVERFQSSQIYSHLMSLSGSTMRGRLGNDLKDRNLVGTPDAVSEQISRYVEAGVCTFAGMLFATDDVEATLDAMALFSEEVGGQWTP